MFPHSPQFARVASRTRKRFVKYENANDGAAHNLKVVIKQLSLLYLSLKPGYLYRAKLRFRFLMSANKTKHILVITT